MDTKLLTELVLGLLRHFGAGICAWLVMNGVLTQEQTSLFLVGIAGFLVMLLWSFYNKYGLRMKVATALEMPAGTTETKLDNTIAAGGGTTVAPK